MNFSQVIVLLAHPVEYPYKANCTLPSSNRVCLYMFAPIS